MMALFITFEGCEGCGKSTQSRSLHRKLTGLSRPAILVHEPGGTKLGDRIGYLLKWAKNVPISPMAELLLFNASRANLVDAVVRPALETGKIVICDRFVDSTVAYQGYGRRLDLATVKSACDTATRGLKPDLTVLLDVPVEEGLRRKATRRGHDRFEQADVSFHNRVRQGFLNMAKDERSRWLVVDGTCPKDEVKWIIWQNVESLLASGYGRREDNIV